MQIPDPIIVTIKKHLCPLGSTIYYDDEALDLALQTLSSNAIKIGGYCVTTTQYPELDSGLNSIQQWTHLTLEEYGEAFEELAQAGYLTLDNAMSCYVFSERPE